MNLTNINGKHSAVRAKLLAAAGFNGTGKPSCVSTITHENAIVEFNGITLSKAKWTLYQGDCKRALGLIPKDSVNCVITSPPYYCQRDYGIDGQIGHEPTIAGYVQGIVKCFEGVWRVLRDDGVVFLNIGDTFYSAKGKPHGSDKKNNGRLWSRIKLRPVDGPGLGLPRKSLIGIPWRVAIAMQDAGWTLRSDVIWKRPRALPEPTAHDRPWLTHEHIFLFAKKPHYWFNRSAIAGEEDIWHIPPRPDTPGAHFAPFPLALPEKCISCGCPPKGVVLDPFVGSGTTMVAALKTGRSTFGIELHPDFCEYTIARIIKSCATRPNKASPPHPK